MASDVRNDLWKELDLLQPIVDKFDDFSFRIKNWFLTMFAAVIGYAVVNAKQELLWVNFLLIAIFYLYEVTYRISHRYFLKRCREIQKLLRQGSDVPDGSKPPNLDKYLMPNDENITITTNWFFTLQKKMGVDEERAYRNVYEWKTWPKESLLFVFRFRVSLPYFAAILGNLIVLVFLLIC